MPDTEQLIIVKQLPVIEEELRRVRDDIEQRIEDALSMECTEETYKNVKAARADLSKEANEWETRRKAVKAQVMAPYEQFEAVYKENIIGPFKAADAKLKARVAEVEDSLKEQKCREAEKYFYELMDSLSIPREIISFGRAGIRVTLSGSLSQLKQQCADKLGQISADIEAISYEEHPAEIMAEYAKHYNLAKAKTDVCQRFEEIEAAREAEKKATLERIEKQKRALEVQIMVGANDSMVEIPIDSEPIEAEQIETQPEPEPDPIHEPEADPDAQKIMTVAFKVTGTKASLKLMKQFFIDNGIGYESLKKTNIDGGTYYGGKH